MEAEVIDSITARKVQKADREKLRRDRLNEHFMELGNTLVLALLADPDRPKNDKASILTDTILMLKDLTSQVDRLKSEYAALNEEFRELIQENNDKFNDLREEKDSLKSDIENLNAQYSHRMRAMYPWAGMDHSVVMHSSTYPYPVPMPITMPAGPIPLHPSLQPYPYYNNQNPPVVHNPCSTYIPYVANNAVTEHHSTQHAVPQSNNRSNGLGKQGPRYKNYDGESRIEKSDDSNDITTDLELKTPGSTSEQDSLKQKKAKKIKEVAITDASSSSACSSAQGMQTISSNSVVGGKTTDN
ncbi:basic helix-loop-helix (bHLH) DNA-bindingsuperfamily protein [Striga asiatica]|uniref:Basic helix-loop-helix (BHLH) DNA-bindingsuperfamily protein n=1 Tax=Striga asiatica TaxID=4170 RepID=A0A5A7REM4_STRAF|nr:basic helix-loop-helix (bHLH) DNA-bindingsuperfamily protein [Striga asiatica]